jgi:glycosyltransferase involved in cell wall biosynthesis
MKITVILCTYNRCASVAQTLESIAASVLPDSTEWEVLVVDNNSTDQTRDVIEDFCRRYPAHFRYLFEPSQGKSRALNAGIRAARGDILAFVDDDVTVAPMWLENLTKCLRDGTWAGAGGRTVTGHAFSMPNWLSLEAPYYAGAAIAALFDLGDKTCQLDFPPYGANMAFRKAMFEKYGGFRTDLGPQPGSQIRNEDTEFGRRLMAAGERLKYEPFAIVYHPILEARITKKYFLAWWFAYGLADVREWKLRHGPPIWGIRRSYLRALQAAIRQILPRVWQWLFSSDPVKRFYYKCQVWRAVGWIVELYGDQRDTQFQQGSINNE